MSLDQILDHGPRPAEPWVNLRANVLTTDSDLNVGGYIRISQASVPGSVTPGWVLTASDTEGNASWAPGGGGPTPGDVVGPSSAIVNSLPVYSTDTGKLIGNTVFVASESVVPNDTLLVPYLDSTSIVTGSVGTTNLTVASVGNIGNLTCFPVGASDALTSEGPSNLLGVTDAANIVTPNLQVTNGPIVGAFLQCTDAAGHTGWTDAGGVVETVTSPFPDLSLTITPSTGNVTAKVNPNNAMNWLVPQQFSAGVLVSDGGVIYPNVAAHNFTAMDYYEPFFNPNFNLQMGPGGAFLTTDVRCTRIGNTCTLMYEGFFGTMGASGGFVFSTSSIFEEMRPVFKVYSTVSASNGATVQFGMFSVNTDGTLTWYSSANNAQGFGIGNNVTILSGSVSYRCA